MFAHLSRISPQTYHLINPNQPADVCVYEAGQLRQCLAFDAHLRSIENNRIMGPILAPAGYKDLARLFNEFHQGPERFATFERKEDGSVALRNDINYGPPVTSELLGLESPSSQDGNGAGSQVDPPEDINAYVMVDIPQSANTLNPVRERIERVKELGEELSKFYLTRAQHEEEYALGLFKLNDLISAHYRDAPSGDLQASVAALVRATEAQATAHSTLSIDIKKEVDSIVARFSESSTELEEIMSASGSTLSENALREDTGDISVAYTPEDSEFRSRCVQLQKKNLTTIKEVMWSCANHVSTACVADDEACEVVRVALEKLEPSEEASNVILRRQVPSLSAEAPVAQSSPTPAAPIPSSNQSRTQLQSVQVNAPSRYLFRVRALFDYEPADTEDLRLKKGDTIGVTMISDDGWWKGELLSGPRRGAVGMVPSNFVTTQNVHLGL